MKTCSRCHKEKLISEFWKDASRKDKLNNSCKTCLSAYAESRPSSRANYTVGKTPKLFVPNNRQAVKDAQGGVCAICGGQSTDHKGLRYDHDHITGAGRGMLCHKCNSALGFLNDDPQLVLAAAQYLIYHNTNSSSTVRPK